MSRKLACAALAAAASTVIAIRPAWPCGGGGFDLGFGGGGEAKCQPDPSEVHGRRTCGGFGGWRKKYDAHVFEVITTTAYVSIGDLDTSGSIEHTDGTSYSYRVVSDDLRDDDGRAGTAGIALRYLFHGPVLYVGAEMGLAHINANDIDRKIDPDSGAMLSPKIDSAVTAAGVLGARTFVYPLGEGLPVTVGAEVAGGVRGVVVTAESRHGSCVVEESTTYTQPMVEARGRADLWLSPRLSLGAYAGGDVISGSPSGGMIFSVHVRAFDGAR